MMIWLIIGLEVVCVGVGIFRYQQLRPPALRLLVLYLSLALLIDLLLEWLPDPGGTWTRGQYDLMLPTELAVYVSLFRPAPRWLFRLAVVGLFSLGLYQLAVHLQERMSSTNLYVVMCLLLLPVVLLYLWSLATSDRILTLRYNPLFWIAVGLLFSCAGNAIVTGFYFLLSDRFPSEGKNLFYINYALTALRYGMFTVAFAIAGPQQDER